LIRAPTERADRGRAVEQVEREDVVVDRIGLDGRDADLTGQLRAHGAERQQHVAAQRGDRPIGATAEAPGDRTAVRRDQRLPAQQARGHRILTPRRIERIEVAVLEDVDRLPVARHGADVGIRTGRLGIDRATCADQTDQGE
jgi:hypothetical protein